MLSFMCTCFTIRNKFYIQEHKVEVLFYCVLFLGHSEEAERVLIKLRGHSNILGELEHIQATITSSTTGKKMFTINHNTFLLNSTINKYSSISLLPISFCLSYLKISLT